MCYLLWIYFCTRTQSNIYGDPQMGRQYNKHEKQARRKQYLKRVKLRVKEAIKAAKKK